jgi:hypothetical protein
LTARCVWVVLILLTAFAAICPWADDQGANGGIWVLALAAGVCLFGAIGALLLDEMFQASGQMLAGNLIGMMVRMAVPLGFCLFIYAQRGALARSGGILYVLVFYLIVLATETWMAVGRVNSPS